MISIAGGLVIASAGLSLATSGLAAAATFAFGAPVEVAATNGGIFNSVSCTGATGCTAVGTDGNTEPIYATESGGTWGSATVSPGGVAIFNGVSCTDATDCTAVGQGNNEPIYATESGGTWGSATAISPPGVGGFFNGVSCTAATDCTAVGFDGNDEPLYATESGGTWGSATEISAPGGSGFFFAVSCTDATDCTAVGFGGNEEPMYATESGGTWGSATEISAPNDFGVFYGVSCTDATDCTAVGKDGNEEPMYATESGGTWGSVTEISGSSGDSIFRAVSCTDATDCTAVGQDNDSAPMYAAESAGTWGSATEISAPGGNGDFYGVSCTDATHCTAAGQDGNGEPMYAQSPASPSIATTPDPTSASLSSSPTVLNDSAVLSGGADPTGTITFSLYYDGRATAVYSDPVTVDNGNDTYTTSPGYAVPSGATGTYQWDASYSGDSNNNGMSDNGATDEQVTVSKSGQSVHFTSKAPTDATFGGPTYTPKAKATSSLPVGFKVASTSTTVCAVSQGKVSFIGVGTCTVVATQAGSADYNPASTTQSFKVDKAPTKTTAAPARVTHSEKTTHVTMTATLKSLSSGAPIRGQRIAFTLVANGWSVTGTAVTDKSGVATFSVSFTRPDTAQSYSASYRGTKDYDPSSASKSI